MIKHIFLGLFVLVSFKVISQTPDIVLEESNLPIFIIDTENNAPVVDEPKINANLSIIDNGTSVDNKVTDPATVYNGHIGIEIRGNFSATLPQKPYGFETRDELGENLNIPLFHMPKENDWILLANYNDKVMMRNSLTFHLSREMGHYAPRTKHCEVILNGSYDGIYILTEKIKQDKNRVNVSNLKPDENSGDDLTGGYIFKVDYFEQDGSDSWLGDFSPENVPFNDVRYVYHDPKAKDISSTQKEYIKDYISGFETVLFGDNFTDENMGYRAYIDVLSFIDYLIISELSRNPDAYKKSKYYHKDKDSKGGLIISGPVWDYDWGYKNINGGGTDGSGFAHTTFAWMTPTPNGWIERLMKDPWFVNQLGNRYAALRATIMSNTSIDSFIDREHQLLDQAQERHYQRWPILGINVGTPEGNEPQPSTYAGVVNKFKNWINVRLEWLDENMPEGTLDVEDISKNTNHSVIRVFPNPVKQEGYLYIESNYKPNQLSIINSLGVVVKRFTKGLSLSNRIDVSQLSAGTYFLKAALSNNTTLSHKIIIK
ncbi:CotH kinase family protein [uncultured Algibacter sp.]|uniref:CotH kinase family protein n=1 Tax=uncultured Algibacter sp. TaxID=298659 RepID=UPI00262F6DE2|nr:CotH kinase family protein [uncultured Algibacter sp.]